MPVNLTSTPTSRIACTFALIVASAVVGACSKDAKGSPPDSPVGQAGGATPAAGVSGNTLRVSPSITLAATDVATIVPSNIEAGVALTGDLRPIETIGVRARIEGDITNVYVREGQQVSAGQLPAHTDRGLRES